MEQVTIHPTCKCDEVEGKDIEFCLNCGISSFYSYCDRCQKLADDQENYEHSYNNE